MSSLTGKIERGTTRWQEVIRIEFEIHDKDEEYDDNASSLESQGDARAEEHNASRAPRGGMFQWFAGGRAEQARYIPSYDRTTSTVHLIILTEEGGHNSGR